MTKTLSLAVAAALLAACGSNLDPNTVRSALPQASTVQIGTPAADPSSTALTAGQLTQALGQTPSYQSEYATVSYWTAFTVNVGVAFTLDLVKFITALSPTSCDTSSCTWGPWVGDAGLNRYELVVEKQGDAFAWALSGQNAITNAAFVPLVSGIAYPGPDRDHGKGSFTIDFDAQDALAHGPAWVKEDFGTVAVQYDNLASISIQATLLGGRDRDPASPDPMNAIYSFTRDPGHGGELQVAFENLSTSEILSLRTRWTGTGAGRADAHYVAGTVDAVASECWAGEALGFVERYDSTVPFGDEVADCVFYPAAYSDLVLP
jgi:hypothetical protein